MLRLLNKAPKENKTIIEKHTITMAEKQNNA